MSVIAKKRILIVDDISDWRRLLSTLLIEYDLELLTSYKEASKVIGQAEFDIAILDVRLEDNNIFNVDGIDLLKKIKMQQPKTGIIILTGYHESIRDQILREYKPDIILNKETFDNREFRAIVQKLAYPPTEL